MTALFAVLALVPMVRFLILWAANGEAAGNVQSLIFGAIMSVAALLALALGVLSELQRTNRILLEEQLERIKELQYRRDPSATPSWESWSTEAAREIEEIDHV